MVAVGTVTLPLVPSVTDPFSHSARPVITTPLPIVIDVSAIRLPINGVPPNVAELPICQKTLLAFAPLLKMTLFPVVVVSVDATWKTKTAFGSPLPFSVRFPDDMASEDVDL